MRTCKRIKIYRTETENEKLKEDQEIWNSDRECKPLGGSGDREQRHRMKIVRGSGDREQRQKTKMCKRIRRYRTQSENENLLEDQEIQNTVRE